MLSRGPAPNLYVGGEYDVSTMMPGLDLDYSCGDHTFKTGHQGMETMGPKQKQKIELRAILEKVELCG